MLQDNVVMETDRADLEDNFDYGSFVLVFFFFFFRSDVSIVLDVGEENVAVDDVEGVQAEVGPEVGDAVAAELHLVAEC